MICKSCGAEFSVELLQCPFCGTENEKEAIEQQEEYIAQVEQKIEAVKDMPEQVANKANTWLTKLIVVIVVVAVLLLVGAFIVTRWLDVTSLDRQQKKLDKLEVMYQEQRYEEMAEYLEDLEEHGGAFQKYEIAVTMFEDLDDGIERLESYHSLASNNPDLQTQEDYSRCFSYVMEKLLYIDELEAADFVYGEETMAKEAREKYMQALSEYLFLTEVEIQAAKEEYVAGAIQYEKWQQLTLERMK